MGGCSSDKNSVDTGAEDVRYRDIEVTGGKGALGPHRLVGGWTGFNVGPEKRVFLVTFKGRSSHGHIEQALLDRHMAHLQHLAESCQLDGAGVYASGDRGLQLLIASNFEEATTLAGSDPLLKEGYYTACDIEELGRC